MRTVLRFLLAFFLVAVAVVAATAFLGVEFGREDYWNYHGALLLVGLAIFPRITLLLSSIPSGGLIWWLGWLFAPRILVAILATLAYWYQNPVLVVFSWLVAFGGESSEKYVVVNRGRRSKSEAERFRDAKWVDKS